MQTLLFLTAVGVIEEQDMSMQGKQSSGMKVTFVDPAK